MARAVAVFKQGLIEVERRRSCASSPERPAMIGYIDKARRIRS